MKRTTLILAILAALALAVRAAELSQSNSVSDKILLLDNLGRVVKVSTNELSPSLHPTASVGLKHQLPDPAPGSSLPVELQQRMQIGREGREGFQFFPAVPPHLMPYLASQDEYGNTALRPGGSWMKL